MHTTETQYLSIVAISNRTNIPESTIRAYIKSFKEFFSYKGRGRKRRFEPVCVDVVRNIREFYAKGYDKDTITYELMRLFPISYDLLPQQQQQGRDTADGMDINDKASKFITVITDFADKFEKYNAIQEDTTISLKETNKLLSQALEKLKHKREKRTIKKLNKKWWKIFVKR